MHACSFEGVGEGGVRVRRVQEKKYPNFRYPEVSISGMNDGIFF